MNTSRIAVDFCLVGRQRTPAELRVFFKWLRLVRRVKRFVVSRQNYYDSASGDTQDESNQAEKALGNIEFLPEEDITTHYANCAVVGNSGLVLIFWMPAPVYRQVKFALSFFFLKKMNYGG